MENEIYSRTIQPFTDMASALYNGLYKRRATFPCQDAQQGRTTSIIYNAPCDITRHFAIEQLEQISDDSKSPIVRGTANFFLRRRADSTKK